MMLINPWQVLVNRIHIPWEVFCHSQRPHKLNKVIETSNLNNFLPPSGLLVPQSKQLFVDDLVFKELKINLMTLLKYIMNIYVYISMMKTNRWDNSYFEKLIYHTQDRGLYSNNIHWKIN